MKKNLFFALLLLGLFSSCRAQTNTRAQLVKQLLELETALLKEDKQKVTTFFNFPVQDDKMKLKVEFDGENVIVVPLLDKRAFLENYSRIVPSDLLELFKQLDLSQLKSKDEITKNMVPKGNSDFCQYTYEVNIKGGEVEMAFFLNTRDDIKLGEDDFCPEYAEFWTFEMINGKLKFKGIEFAG